ncbi:hypothetical protein IAE22_35695 [Bacillus sp. S34]|nr:hypothetical protein [Bacillus sp. S34]
MIQTLAESAAPTMAAVNPNDGNALPPWLFVIVAIVIVGVAVVLFARRKR